MILLGDASVGEDLTRWTIRLALAGYLASVLLLWLPFVGVQPLGCLYAVPHRLKPGLQRHAARIVWTLACLAYLAHVACAFHFYHEWSHQRAYQHTAEKTAAVTGWSLGGGVYVNYAFTLMWVGDVLWWWLAPRSYVSRGVASQIALHAFFLFIIFNATVVFGSGPIRALGLAGFVLLCIIGWRWTQRVARDSAVSSGSR